MTASPVRRIKKQSLVSSSDFYIVITVINEMGSGCFSPKPAQKDLAIFLIEQIHNAPITVTRQSAYLDNVEEYAQIKQKINKMSNLKKLIDFLHSHRHKISDALANNLNVCTQKATLQNWIKGLVVLERLINMCYPHVSKDSKGGKPFKFLNNLLNHESSADNYEKKTEEYSTNLIRKTQKENQPNFNCHLVDSLLNEIQNVKFQNLALTLIRRCFAYQDLYSEVLAVLDRYLLIRSNNLQNDEQSLQVLQCVFEKIGQKNCRLRSLETYVKLVTKIREKKVIGLVKQFDFFLKRWIKIKSGNLSMKSVKEMGQLENEVGLLEFIINKFVHSALSQLTYEPIVITLLQLYENSGYEMQQEYEDFFVETLKSIDMGESVLKFMILGFFYSGIKHNIVGDFQGLLEFNSRFGKEETKPLDNKSLEKLIHVLQRWLLQKKIVKLQEIVKYHSSLVIRYFAQMLSIENKKLNQLLRKFYQSILNQCSNEMNVFVSQCIFAEYEKKQTSSKLRTNLLLVSHLNLTRNKIHTETKIVHFSLDTAYLNSQEIINFYISLCYFYGKFDSNTVNLYTEEICQLLSSICKFLKHNQLTTSQISSLVKSVLQLLIEIAECRYLLAAFQEALLKSQTQVETVLNEESLKLLRQEVTNLLKRGGYLLICDENNKPQEQNDRTFSDCKRFFRDMSDMGLQSKLSRKQQQFENRRSIIKDSCSVDEEQEQSFKDIIQMIKI